MVIVTESFDVSSSFSSIVPAVISYSPTIEKSALVSKVYSTLWPEIIAPGTISEIGLPPFIW